MKWMPSSFASSGFWRRSQGRVLTSLTRPQPAQRKLQASGIDQIVNGTLTPSSVKSPAWYPHRAALTIRFIRKPFR